MSVHVVYSYALARIMRKRGYSTRRLAAAAQVDRAGLRRLRKGETAPSWPVACRIADALGVPLSEFVGRKHKRRNSDVSDDGAIQSEGV